MRKATENRIYNSIDTKRRSSKATRDRLTLSDRTALYLVDMPSFKDIMSAYADYKACLEF